MLSSTIEIILTILVTLIGAVIWGFFFNALFASPSIGALLGGFCTLWARHALFNER